MTEIAKFRVWVRCESNDLNGMVEVISLTSSHAKWFALRQFFPGRGWEVTKVERLRLND